jgi:hypothetical protein
MTGKFIFNDYGEFGLFLKINSEEIKDSVEEQEKKDKVDECVKFFNAAKGGCPCNIKKRIEAAKTGYSSFVSAFFPDNKASTELFKSYLDAEEILFKNDSEDEEPFFLI